MIEPISIYTRVEQYGKQCEVLDITLKGEITISLTQDDARKLRDELTTKLAGWDDVDKKEYKL